jgi:hypothetical protein
MKTVRIAFRFGDDRLFSRLVCWVRGGDSAHCEAAERLLGDMHACVSASFLDGGVRGKMIELPASKWRIYEVPAFHDMFRWEAAHRDSGYDWVGLLGLVFAGIRHWHDAWFCSEVCAAILGLDDPHRYDLMRLEEHCARVGKRIQ